MLPLLLPLPLPQAAVAHREAAEHALEEDARSVLGGKDNLADASKDVAGKLQDKAAGVYDKAKQRVARHGKKKAEQEL